jgi:hypothetical protein
MLNTFNYQKITINKYIVLEFKGHIIVTEADNVNYLFKSQILFECKADESFQKNHIFKILSKHDELPSDFLEAISTRSRDLKGEFIELFISESNPYNFCPDKKFAIHYGIKDPIPVKLTIIETFDNENDFDKSFTNYGTEAFGFWNMETDKISSSFVWTHPMQTKMCFSDYAHHDISKGSLFLKFKIDRV